MTRVWLFLSTIDYDAKDDERGSIALIRRMCLVVLARCDVNFIKKSTASGKGPTWCGTAWRQNSANCDEFLG